MYFILIGLLIDSVSMACLVAYQFNFSDKRKGMPIGIIFYVLGFVMLLNRKPFLFSLGILFCCLLFYLAVVFSAVIAASFEKLVRQLKAYQRRVFYSLGTSEASIRGTIVDALEYLTKDKSEAIPTGWGYMYVTSAHCVFKEAVVCMLKSGECHIDVSEDTPGHLKSGQFTSDMTGLGFVMDNWKVDKRKQIVVPSQDYDKIPLFIEILFGKYYNCGEKNQIRVDVLKMR